MDGRRALVYSRIRTNKLDPSDNDLTRGARQQQVAAAVGDKIASFGTFLRLPFIGDSLAAPLTTDLTAGELVKLGWVRFRADSSRSLHCRLGGEPASIGGESVLLGSEDNLEVIAMFLRRTARAPAAEGRALRRRLHAAPLAVGRGASSRPCRPCRSCRSTSSRRACPRSSRTTCSPSCARRGRSRWSRSPSP